MATKKRMPRPCKVIWLQSSIPDGSTVGIFNTERAAARDAKDYNIKCRIDGPYVLAAAPTGSPDRDGSP